MPVNNNKPQLIGGIDSNGNLVPVKVGSDGSLGVSGGGGGQPTGGATSAKQDEQTVLLNQILPDADNASNQLNNVVYNLSQYFTNNGSGQNIWAFLSNLTSSISQAISYNPGASWYPNSIAGIIESIFNAIGNTSTPTATSDTGSAPLNGLIKRLLQKVQSTTSLPAPTDSAIITTLRDNVNTAKSLTLTGSGTSTGIIINNVDVSDYSLISLQTNNTFSGVVRLEGTNDLTTGWTQLAGNIVGNTNYGMSNSIISSGFIIHYPKQTKFVRVNVTSYTSGTIGVTLFLSTGSPTQIQPSSTITVDTELPTATTLTDATSPTPAVPVVGSAGLIIGNGNTSLVRIRGCSATSGEGLGKQKVASGTESIPYIINFSSPGTYSSLNLGSVYKDISFQLLVSTGTLTSLDITFQGSLGGGWHNIASTNSITSGLIIYSLNQPVQYVRAVVNAITGTSLVMHLYCGAC